MRRSITAVFVLGLAIATPAAADPYTITIAYSRAELQSEASAAALYQQIVDAAQTVCRQANLDAYDQLAARQWCEQRAVMDAVDKADLPALAAIHDHPRSTPTPETSLTETRLPEARLTASAER